MAANLKWLLSWGLIGLLLLPCLANNVRSQAKAKPRLSFTLSLPAGRVCVGAKSFQVIGELKNIGDEDVVIDRKGLWHGVSFAAVEGRPAFAGIGDPGFNYKHEGDYVLLKPGESYKASRTYGFGPEFLSRAGVYQLRTAYFGVKPDTPQGAAVFLGKLESNDFRIEIVPCAK